MSMEWRDRYQADDSELEKFWAEWCELQKAPQPDYKPNRTQLWPTVAFIALFLALGCLYWTRV